MRWVTLHEALTSLRPTERASGMSLRTTSRFSLCTGRRNGIGNTSRTHFQIRKCAGGHHKMWSQEKLPLSYADISAVSGSQDSRSPHSSFLACQFFFGTRCVSVILCVWIHTSRTTLPDLWECESATKVLHPAGYDLLHWISEAFRQIWTERSFSSEIIIILPIGELNHGTRKRRRQGSVSWVNCKCSLFWSCHRIISTSSTSPHMSVFCCYESCRRYW